MRIERGTDLTSSDRGMPPPEENLEYDRAPFQVIWEVTRACDLACVHCRRSASQLRDPDEISGAEARALLGRIRQIGTRTLVLTGGDPFKRPDIFELIASARDAGLNPVLSASVTPLLTREALARGRDAGLSAVSLGLDGCRAGSHDAFRGIAGSFDRTLAAASAVRETGLELQIDTTMTSGNFSEMEAASRLVSRVGARAWSVFFLVPMLPAHASLQITAMQCEELLIWFYELSRTAPFRIRTIEAPHYRRVILQMTAAGTGLPVEEIIGTTGAGHERFLPCLNDARGTLFLSHRGEVWPSGFLPLAAGNVRETHLELIYRDSVLFRDLRDPGLLKGRCGRCPFRSLCGGSRARAFAAAGDPLGEDPLCGYDPGGGSPSQPSSLM